MNWQDLSVKDVLKTLNTSLNGLTDEEAEKRISDHGNNELIEKKKSSPLKLFLMQFIDILIILLIVAAIAAYFVGDTVDSIVIFLVVFVNALIGFIQEHRAEKAMEKLKKLVSNKSTVIRDGKKQKIPARELTIGDLVVIEEGDNIPADLRIIESINLSIDESSITGESLPVSKLVEHSPDEGNDNDNSMDNIALMESYVTSGRGKGLVIEIGMNTGIGRIAEMIQEDESKTPLQIKISSLGKTLGLIAIFTSALVFILQFLKGIPLVETFLSAVSLAVAAVPEGLPAILTLTLALGMQRMAKSKAVVRKLLAVETLGSCTYICTDKTGTLTENKMIVMDSKLFNTEKALEIALLCNNAYVSKGTVIGDPTDGALLSFAEKNEYTINLRENYPRAMEIPLSSERKRMTTVNEINGVKHVLSKGAPEIILNQSNRLYCNNHIITLTNEYKTELLSQINEMTSKAFRVIALAFKEIKTDDELSNIEKLEQNLIFTGLIGIMDPPRKEAAEAVKTCKNAGIHVVMITGDHKDTASAIAREIGILTSGKVLTGSQLNEMDDEAFDRVIEEVQVYARVFPEQKVRIVQSLQKRGNIVSMTGDGVNDAPALKKAAIGVSMGTGTDVAKEASDMVLQDDNFATIVQAIKEGRTIFDNIRRFVKFQLSTNIGAILTIVTASITNLPIPFNPIQILWINIIMDGPPAQSLGVEPPEKGIMNRKPENENILPGRNLMKIIFAGIVMAVGTLMIYYWALLSGCSLVKATTIAFTVFVMFQIFNVFNCKAKGEFSNRLLLISITASFLMQLAVVYLPFLQGIFKTTALSLIDWGLIFIVASLILVSEKLVMSVFK